MPPRAPRPSSLTAWKCPQCSTRAFSSHARRLALGPEHPRFIEIPEPPQQNSPERHIVKGFLPPPRNIFAGAAKHKDSEETLAQTIPLPTVPRSYAPGSREEWKVKMAALRRQNLRESVPVLRSRQVREKRRSRARSVANSAERERVLAMPQREDERLTTPSLGLDFARLASGTLVDPTREERLQRKAQNLEAFRKKQHERQLDSLHTLYMNAREFIVTPQQLDEAIDDAFGTPEDPVYFGAGSDLDLDNSRSVWAEGRPLRVQDMLNRARGQGSLGAALNSSKSSAYDAVNKRRIQRIAEMFTGGKMDGNPTY